MLKCSFCSDLAVLECTGNRFCSYHRSQHDDTHTGGHLFKDIFCQLSESCKIDFQDEITRRLKTLKDCKNKFASTTAEYIKRIQGILYQRIAEIDKLCQFYINLLQKGEFVKDDSVEIDKILSTRLIIKELGSLPDTKFKDYIYQEIIETKEFDLKRSKLKENLKKLSSVARFLLDIIRSCNPINIPERMLREITEKNHGENGWSKAKREILNLQIVSINENRKLWSIDESVLKDLSDGDLLGSANTECLSFFATNFVIDQEIVNNIKTKRDMQEMLPHVEKIIKDSKINNEDEVNVLLNLSIAYVLLDYNEEKVENYSKELIQKVNLMNNNEITTVNKLMTICEAYTQIFNYEPTEKMCLQCLKILERVLPENHYNLATLYMKLGTLYSNKASYDKAEKFFLQCLKIQEQTFPENHPDRAGLCTNFGSLYLIKGAYDDAQQFFLKSLKIQEKILPKHHPNLAGLYMNLGILYKNKEEYDNAEQFFLQCLKIQEQILPDNHPNQASLYMNLGNLYESKAALDKAEQFYLQSLKIQEQVLDKNHPYRASLYLSLGNLYESKAAYNEAEKFYLKCLQIYEQALPEHLPNRAGLYMSLANLYTKTAAYDKAEWYYLQCLKIREQILPEYHLDRAKLYMSLGSLYYCKEKYKEAENYYVKSLKINEKVLPSNHHDIKLIYRMLKDISNKLVSL